MLTLLRRDYLLNRRVLWLTYGLWSVLWLGYPVLSPDGQPRFDAWAAMVALACAFLPVMMLGREDKFRAGAQVCSLPVTREAIVASRFVGGWIVALAGVALAITAMGMLGLAGFRPFTPPTPMLPVAVAATIGVTIALMLPLAIRFGVAGTLALLVSLQIAGMAALVLSRLFGARGGIISWTAGAVRSAGAWLDTAVGPIGLGAVVLTATFGLNVAAYALSVWLYRRREF